MNVIIDFLGGVLAITLLLVTILLLTVLVFNMIIASISLFKHIIDDIKES